MTAGVTVVSPGMTPVTAAAMGMTPAKSPATAGPRMRTALYQSEKAMAVWTTAR